MLQTALIDMALANPTITVGVAVVVAVALINRRAIMRRLPVGSATSTSGGGGGGGSALPSLPRPSLPQVSIPRISLPSLPRFPRPSVGRLTESEVPPIVFRIAKLLLVTAVGYVIGVAIAPSLPGWIPP